MNWADLVTIKPFDHQLEAARLMYSKAQGFANFGEMGTGKTLSAIMTMNALALEEKVRRVLIVCPVSLKRNWRDEIKEHSELRWKVDVLDGTGKKRSDMLDRITRTAPGYLRSVVITNYDSVSRLAGKLSMFNPDMIIADEVHAIKSHRSKRTRALKSVPCRYRIAMTGTPLVCSPLDVWSVFDWIRPGHLIKNFYAFRNRYCVVFTGAGFPMIKAYRNLEELKQRCDMYSCRKLKEECLDLPDKTFTTVKVSMTPQESRAYSDMAAFLIAEIEAAGEPVVASTVLTKMLRLQQITGGIVTDGERKLTIDGGSSKIAALKDLLESLEDHKVVVFARFTGEIERIVGECAAMGRRYHVLAGATSDAERHEAVRMFQREGGNDVMIANVAVGGVGITLTKASHCVYFSNTWSLGDRLQSQDRLHRIGQKDAVTYYDIVAEGTIDEYILKVLNKKSGLSDKITGDDARRMIFA